MKLSDPQRRWLQMAAVGRAWRVPGPKGYFYIGSGEHPKTGRIIDAATALALRDRGLTSQPLAEHEDEPLKIGLTEAGRVALRRRGGQIAA